MASEVAPISARPLLAPAPSLLLGLVAGALFGARRGLPKRVRAAATVGGLALIGAAARQPLADALLRAGARRRGGEVAFSFVVPHPVEVVFDFLRNFENYPQFIGALREVHDYGDGRSHWSASTSSGHTVEWDTVTTKYVPNAVIAWQSVPASPVRMSAAVRIVPEGKNTCVKISGAYSVVGGDMADAIVALATPRRVREVERDVRHLNTYLDTVVASRTPSVSD
jgi:uncharacterized membrane protein